MRRICVEVLAIIFLLIGFVAPHMAAANGGDQRVAAGRYIVNLSRVPFTPRAGQETKMVFSFGDLERDALVGSDLIARVRIARQSAQPKFIFDRGDIAASGGVLELPYTFAEAGLHEIFISFAFASDPDTLYDPPDFLLDVQEPRAARSGWFDAGSAGIGFAAGLLGTILFLFLRSPKQGPAVFLFILALLVAAGFAGYYFSFLGFIYNVMMPEAFGKFPLVILAMLFGTAAFFSPCSFTVLPAYVSHYMSGGGAMQDQPSENALRRALAFGLVAALGVITVNVIIGLIIAALGAAAPFAKDPRQDIPLILGVRAVAGLVIAVMGVFALLNKPLPIPTLPLPTRRPDFAASVFLYGLLYNGAAIGCTGPILLGLILYALTTGSFTSALMVFVVFALTMGAWMLILTIATAFFKGTVKAFLPFSAAVRKTAGAVMLVVGLGITILTLEGNRIFVQLLFPFLP